MSSLIRISTVLATRVRTDLARITGTMLALLLLGCQQGREEGQPKRMLGNEVVIRVVAAPFVETHSWPIEIDGRAIKSVNLLRELFEDYFAPASMTDVTHFDPNLILGPKRDGVYWVASPNRMVIVSDFDTPFGYVHFVLGVAANRFPGLDQYRERIVFPSALLLRDAKGNEVSVDYDFSVAWQRPELMSVTEGLLLDNGNITDELVVTAWSSVGDRKLWRGIPSSGSDGRLRRALAQYREGTDWGGPIVVRPQVSYGAAFMCLGLIKELMLPDCDPWLLPPPQDLLSNQDWRQ